MSLYAQYIKERDNKNIIEDEKGFATYCFIKDGTYIQDIYVHPDHRHSHVASQYADKIAQIAREKGHTKLFGSVRPSANFSTESLKVLLAYGFRIDSAAQDAIFLVKEI